MTTLIRRREHALLKISTSYGMVDSDRKGLIVVSGLGPTAQVAPFESERLQARLTTIGFVGHPMGGGLCRSCKDELKATPAGMV